MSEWGELTNPQTATVGELFQALRESLEKNMELLLNRDDTGQYPAAILMVVGSEALSRLQGKSEHCVFAQMMGRRDLEEPLARDLFDALRQGLAHIWDTNFLKVEESFVLEMVVCKSVRRQHLSVRTTPTRGINMDVYAMWEDLRAVLSEYAATLERDQKLASSPPPKQWTDNWLEPADPRNIRAWREYVSRAPVDNTGEATRAETSR